MTTNTNTFSTIGQINPDAPEAIRNVNIRQGKTFNDIILESDDRMAILSRLWFDNEMKKEMGQ